MQRDPIHQSDLFRSQALDARRASSDGGILLVRPLSLSILTALAAVVLVFMLTLIFCFSYTRKMDVTGRLMPEAGLVKVYARQAGTVVVRHVSEGQRVRQGDVLYEVSSERLSGEALNAGANRAGNADDDGNDGNDAGVQASISRHVRQRAQSLQASMDTMRRVQHEERLTLLQRVKDLKAQVDSLHAQSLGQRARVTIAGETVTRYERLFSLGYISRDQLQARKLDLIDQQQQGQALGARHSALHTQWQAARGELATWGPRQQNQLAEVERALAATRQELAESESRRYQRIVAPRAGVATLATAEQGQTVDGATPLVSIVPAGSELHAELYVPARSAGFVKVDAPVRLRFRAYPHQKFGQYRAVVTSVARSAMTPAELSGMRGIVAAEGMPSSFYRVTARLDAQQVMAHGKPVSLPVGAEFDASLLQDTRKLYEWIVEPLYAVTGRV